MRLAEFEFEVEYRPGRKNSVADGMSRLPTDGDDRRPIEDEIPCFLVSDGTPTLETTNPRPLSDIWDEIPNDDYVENPEVLALSETDPDVTPITTEEFMAAQSNDAFCKTQAGTVGQPGSQYDYDRHGFLVRKSRFDGALQRVVPHSLRARVLYSAHYPRLAGHPGGTRMYMTLRRDFYWPHMGSDAIAVARDCRACAQVRGTANTYQKYLKIFPAAGPLEFVAMDLLGPLPKTKSGHTYVLVITDRFTKLTRAVPLGSTKAPAVAQAFLENWVYVYGAPNFLLTDNGPQFVAKFFEAVCALLGVRHFMTTAYHPQTNGQTERFNRTILDRLRHYVAENQTDWDAYVQPLTFGYNMQVHSEG